jgi:hypothetical protein
MREQAATITATSDAARRGIDVPRWRRGLSVQPAWIDADRYPAVGENF